MKYDGPFFDFDEFDENISDLHSSMKFQNCDNNNINDSPGYCLG